MPAAPLHWMLADRERCLVLEAVEEGLKIYENPFGVLTNNPPFPYHRENMRNYLNLTAGSPCNRLSEELELIPYGQGLGALGLPGDASPASRFVKTVFLKYNSVTEKEEGNAAEAELAEITEFFPYSGAGGHDTGNGPDVGGPLRYYAVFQLHLPGDGGNIISEPTVTAGFRR